MFRSRHFGFTLIELLIVVAIIAILAAIAVPNFLEAQVRSKVSRCRTDLRTIATAIESYMVDHNKYPLHKLVSQTTDDDPVATDPWPQSGGGWTFNEFHFSSKSSITTPVSYLTSIPLDPFYTQNMPVNPGSSIMATGSNPARRQYQYSNSEFGSTNATVVANFQLVYGGWRIWSGGPDLNRRDIYLRSPSTDAMRIYDATNGTKSVGDIWRTQRSQDGSRPTVPGVVD